jgi:O-antigen/teichoic acid export membrane protein
VTEFNSIKQKATKSIKWTTLIEVVSRTIQPAIYLILAKILKPEDFGLASAATLVINFSQLFWDAGLGKALIQTKEDSKIAANVVFWFNLVLGITIYLLLFFFAPYISLFFNSNNLSIVLRVVGIQVILQSLSAVQQALLIKNLEFKRLFIIKISSAWLPGLISIPMAFAGYGVWALVAGTISGSLVNLFMFWFLNPWRPSFSINISMIKRLTNFGTWVLGESLVGWFMNWGDNMIVGHFLGIEILGVYSIAWNICNLTFGLFLNPILSIVYPTLSYLQDDFDLFVETFRRFTKTCLSISLPLGVGFLLVGQEITTVFFSGKWPNLGFVIQLIGLLLGISWVFSTNPEAYRALGRPDLNTKAMLFFLIIYVPTFVISAQINLPVFTIARFVVSLITIPVHIFLAVRFLRQKSSYIWDDGKTAVYSTFVMISLVLFAKFFMGSLTLHVYPIFSLLILISIGVFSYFMTYLFLDRTFITRLRLLVQENFHN